MLYFVVLPIHNQLICDTCPKILIGGHFYFLHICILVPNKTYRWGPFFFFFFSFFSVERLKSSSTSLSKIQHKSGTKNEGMRRWNRKDKLTLFLRFFSLPVHQWRRCVLESAVQAGEPDLEEGDGKLQCILAREGFGLQLSRGTELFWDWHWCRKLGDRKRDFASCIGTVLQNMERILVKRNSYTTRQNLLVVLVAHWTHSTT